MNLTSSSQYQQICLQIILYRFDMKLYLLLLALILFSFWRNVRQWRRHQKNQKSRSDTETEEILGSPKQSTEEMDILDNTECKFNVNSFKIVYVVNSEYYLYKRTALTKAREVGCVEMGRGFHWIVGGGGWVKNERWCFGCQTVKLLWEH